MNGAPAPSNPPRKRLGTTELHVHPLCLGGNVFGWTTDREASFAVLDAYAEAGGNFVDTADVYAAWAPGNRGGESERVIGEWLSSRGLRDEIVVATKVGSGADGLERGLTREHVIAGCEASLRRLGVETIDLYYAHHDFDTPALEETLAAFDDLVRRGQVRHVAASNYGADRLRQALSISEAEGLAAYQAAQPKLNLVDRAAYGPESPGGLPGARRRRRGVRRPRRRLPLRQVPAGGPPPDSARAAGIAGSYLEDPRALAVLDEAERVASESDATIAQVALAWALEQPAVTCVIASATTPAQLDELLAAAELELDLADVRRLDQAGELAAEPLPTVEGPP